MGKQRPQGGLRAELISKINRFTFPEKNSQLNDSRVRVRKRLRIQNKDSGGDANFVARFPCARNHLHRWARWLRNVLQIGEEVLRTRRCGPLYR